MNSASKSGCYGEAENAAVEKEVQRLLPAGGRLLDVGCASGRLLSRFDDQAGFRAGIELDPVAAAAAHAHANELLVGSVEDPHLRFEPASFDVIVCADILEHLVDPLEALKRVAGWCQPHGFIVISLPNIAHWSARLRLLRGRWTYQPTGIFDDTHLRFFTIASALRLLTEASLHGAALQPAVPPPLSYQYPPAGLLPSRLRNRLDRGWGRLDFRAAGWRPQLFAYQFILTASTTAHSWPWESEVGGQNDRFLPAKVSPIPENGHSWFLA